MTSEGGLMNTGGGLQLTITGWGQRVVVQHHLGLRNRRSVKVAVCGTWMSIAWHSVDVSSFDSGGASNIEQFQHNGVCVDILLTCCAVSTRKTRVFSRFGL